MNIIEQLSVSKYIFGCYYCIVKAKNLLLKSPENQIKLKHHHYKQGGNDTKLPLSFFFSVFFHSKHTLYRNVTTSTTAQQQGSLKASHHATENIQLCAIFQTIPLRAVSPSSQILYLPPGYRSRIDYKTCLVRKKTVK